jgi:hypothetical protein
MPVTILRTADGELAAANAAALAALKQRLITSSVVLKTLLKRVIEAGVRVIKRRSRCGHGIHATIVEEIVRALFGDRIGGAMCGMMKKDTNRRRSRSPTRPSARSGPPIRGADSLTEQIAFSTGVPTAELSGQLSRAIEESRNLRRIQHWSGNRGRSVMNRAITQRKMMIALPLALALAGCVGFAPRYDEVLDEKTTSAYENISKFLAEIEMGKYQTPDTFASAANQYAEIQGELAVAEMRAASLPVPHKGTAVRARDLLVSMIQGCKASVVTLSALHKTSGLIPNTGTSAGAQVKCDQAARAARAMKGA